MENKSKNCPDKIDNIVKFLPEQFFKEIDEYKRIYVECSGGYNSTTTVLILFEKGYKNIGIIHNDTKLQYKECLDNLQKLVYITGYSLIFKEPNFKKYRLSEIMKKSFQNIEKAKLDIKNYRSYFVCCKILKNTRNRKWNNDFLFDNSIVISSITPYESRNRQLRLFDLKEKKTFVRKHIYQNVDKAYIYRDLLLGNRKYSRDYFDKLFELKLSEYNMNIKHSGCRICPIRILFPDMLEKNDCSIKYNKIFVDNKK